MHHFTHCWLKKMYILPYYRCKDNNYSNIQQKNIFFVSQITLFVLNEANK